MAEHLDVDSLALAIGSEQGAAEEIAQRKTAGGVTCSVPSAGEAQRMVTEMAYHLLKLRKE